MCLISALHEMPILFHFKVGAGIPELKPVAWVTLDKSFHLLKLQSGWMLSAESLENPMLIDTTRDSDRPAVWLQNNQAPRRMRVF